MITIEVPFSMPARVGDREIEDAISGAISVNLYDDPAEDEINAWRGDRINYLSNALAYKQFAEIERAAIKEARRMATADRAACAISQHEDEP